MLLFIITNSLSSSLPMRAQCGRMNNSTCAQYSNA